MSKRKSSRRDASSGILTQAVGVGRSAAGQAGRLVPVDIRRQVEQVVKDGLKQVQTQLQRTASRADVERLSRQIDQLMKRVERIAPQGARSASRSASSTSRSSRSTGRAERSSRTGTRRSSGTRAT